MSSMLCTANCVVSGRELEVKFSLALRDDEDDADTLRRAHARAKALAANDSGTKPESIQVRHVAMQ